MRKIAVFTGTRAEYGLLYWLLTTSMTQLGKATDDSR